uniref:C-type lectin domain-containing protein n=1 Tax=Xiphophorus couchianus TaxID=32473 RepID=A0A3B5LAS8_9TELE
SCQKNLIENDINDTDFVQFQKLCVHFCLRRRESCGPCPDDWILFNQKCYMFYDEAAPWKTWEESRRFCQDRGADLLAIGDLAEQVKSNGNLEVSEKPRV